MFYRVDEKGQPIDWAVAPYHADCLYTPHQVRYNFEGQAHIDDGTSSFPLCKFLTYYLGVAWWTFLLSTFGTIGLNIWRWVWQ